MMQHYGLIGFPLTHSFSPAYFQQKFAKEGVNGSYQLFPLEDISQFPAVLQKQPGLAGLNVTIPYKEAIVAHLDELDYVAREVGAVNCIRINNGRTKGFNTDVIGFEKSLEPYLRQHHTQALVLGTGGASKAVAYALQKLGIEVKYVSTKPHFGAYRYSDLAPETIAQYPLIVNTTPLGMHPNENESPDLPYEAIGPMHLLYDLIYNPAVTLFLARGAANGATVKNGLEMLQIQAEESWRIWNGVI